MIEQQPHGVSSTSQNGTSSSSDDGANALNAVPRIPVGPLGARALSRRQFLGRSAQQAANVAATATGLVVAAGISAQDLAAGNLSTQALSGEHPATDEMTRTKDATRTIRLGFIGLRNQGLTLLREFAQLPGLEIAALCDVDTKQLKQAQNVLARQGMTTASETSDWRQVARDASLDAVVIATPDHWHFEMARESLEAGRDLYLETPLTLKPLDARTLSQLAAERGRMVQTGLVHRTSQMYLSAIETIRSGVLGKIPLVRSWVTHQRPSIGQRSSIPTPQGVDYLSWLGPAPIQAFHPNRFHQNWQWFWDFGNGELGAWGVPLLDVALWGMDLGLPQHVSASGGRLVSRDDGETPDTLMVEYTYPQTRLLWEHRSWSSHGLEGRSAATAFYGEKGTLIIDRGGWKIYGSNSPVVGEAEALWSPHLSNFIEGIRTRRNPSANLQIATASTAVALLGNIAYRTGRPIELPQQALPMSIPPGEEHLWSQRKVDPV